LDIKRSTDQKDRDIAVSEAQIKKVLDNVMFDIGLVAQSIINEIDFPNENAKAQCYVNVVTQIANNVSDTIMKRNKKGIENIRKENGIDI
jgi:ribosome-binding factor A